MYMCALIRERCVTTMSRKRWDPNPKGTSSIKRSSPRVRQSDGNYIGYVFMV